MTKQQTTGRLMVLLSATLSACSPSVPTAANGTLSASETEAESEATPYRDSSGFLPPPKAAEPDHTGNVAR
ncbi:hypothetical protein V6667_05300 [Neisseria leonii]|uniref:Uncharacterized protein n=1 Tax=Neisseria leonii TaxID=2995413 RepID=A0A9X4E2B1_9NEIS|nr:hypothetical protein [Neisseria sp. 51.81]MDD9328282.1 hypothetical protein [Neisseria sp. 51.81]